MIMHRNQFLLNNLHLFYIIWETICCGYNEGGGGGLKDCSHVIQLQSDHCTHVTQLHNQSLHPWYTVTQPIPVPMLHDYTTNHCTHVTGLHNQSLYPCYTVTQPITAPILHSYTTNHYIKNVLTFLDMTSGRTGTSHLFEVSVSWLSFWLWDQVWIIQKVKSLKIKVNKIKKSEYVCFIQSAQIINCGFGISFRIYRKICQANITKIEILNIKM